MKSILSGALAALIAAGGADVAAAGSRVTITGDGVPGSAVRTVDTFSSLQATGRWTLTATAGKAVQQVVISGDENVLPYVTTTVQGGELVLGVADGYDLIPTLPLHADIDVVSLDGADLGGSVDLTAQGIAGHSFDWVGSGAATAVLSGKVKSVSLRATGAASVDASALSARSGNAQEKGTGTISVDASKTLHAKVAGSGHVYYHGDPVLTQHVSGSGSIEPR